MATSLPQNQSRGTHFLLRKSVHVILEAICSDVDFTVQHLYDGLLTKSFDTPVQQVGEILEAHDAHHSLGRL